MLVFIVRVSPSLSLPACMLHTYDLLEPAHGANDEAEARDEDGGGHQAGDHVG